jgi:uncharacterized protein YgbK (DUF1537 family)
MTTLRLMADDLIGAFDGLRIVSKSGAFGGSDFLARVLGS